MSSPVTLLFHTTAASGNGDGQERAQVIEFETAASKAPFQISLCKLVNVDYFVFSVCLLMKCVHLYVRLPV